MFLRVDGMIERGDDDDYDDIDGRKTLDRWKIPRYGLVFCGGRRAVDIYAAASNVVETRVGGRVSMDTVKRMSALEL